MREVFRFFRPILFVRRFRLGVRLAARIRAQKGRAPTKAEYRAIADEVERRLP